MEPVELINPATWHLSPGDAASHQGTLIALATSGIPVFPLSKPSGKHRCVVGPGFLYGEGQNNSRWNTLTNVYQPKGRHILNAAGVHMNCPYDFSFMKEWVYLSVLDGHRGASPKLLERRLASEPRFYCDVIQLIFRSRNEDADDKKPTEEQEELATNVYRLLHQWNQARR